MDNINSGGVVTINWLDIIIIMILIYSAIKGFLSGLILSLTNLIALVASLIVALYYKSLLTDYLIVVWQLDDKLAPIIKSAITVDQLEQLSNLIPHMLKVTDQVEKVISIEIAQQAINIISFIFLLSATYIIIKAIGYLLHRIMDWGLFAPVNRICGLFFGVIRGFLISFIIVALLTPLSINKVQQANCVKIYNNLIKTDLFMNSDLLFNNRS